ncbi:hypothetical protein PAXRUDRAFT_750486 [Paxillus rubicundulus Ve08.2h10]|uniref:Uncharacterized protein n=1 Tax=Paxillus rubicundulus Ve08.2h10 TaxID=930991 RepID=A0A0D0D0Q5_9AGAM|nr:hypothetical protein PAXRUDRAFT_750486 [Paxillus rubicundulus Ve08.2h10]
MGMNKATFWKLLCKMKLIGRLSDSKHVSADEQLAIFCTLYGQAFLQGTCRNVSNVMLIQSPNALIVSSTFL